MEAKRMHDVETRPSRRRTNGSGPDPDVQTQESTDEVTALLARRLGYVFVRDLSEFPVDPAAFEMVPWKAIRRQKAIPLGFDGKDLIVAVADPINVIGLDDIRTKKSLHGGITTRLKVMADLDIAEKRLPQDGRVTVNIDRKPIDLRVATLPTSNGEKVVLRVLDRSKSVLSLETLGFGPEPLMTYRNSVAKTHGAILLTGPTGSGKSTTMYGTLAEINDPSKNIVTVEDPVETRLPGLNQMQINTKAGLTFAMSLR